MARVRCLTCHKRQGSTIMDANGGKCSFCGSDNRRERWQRSGDVRTGLTAEDRDLIYDVATQAGVTPWILMDLAIRAKMFEWAANPNNIKKDLMLVKLARVS